MATEETGILPLLQARRQALEREKRILSARIAGLNRQVTTTPAGNARWRLFGSSEQLRGVCELLLEAATSQGEAAAQRQEDMAQLAQDNGELVSQLRAEEAKTAFLLEKVGERSGGVQAVEGLPWRWRCLGVSACRLRCFAFSRALRSCRW